jgi:DNA-binding beta-propeller fold protein YncE
MRTDRAGQRPGIAVLTGLLTALAAAPAASTPLTLVQALRQGVDPGVDGLVGAREVAVSPDGTPYTCGQDDQAVSAFARDATTGRLTFSRRSRRRRWGRWPDGAYGLALSPDGAHPTSPRASTTKSPSFRATAPRGATFVEAQEDGVAGVDGLDGAAGVG